MTLAVKDATGATQAIPFPNANGQASMATSAPVVIAGDQIVPVSASAWPLPVGAAADGCDGAGIVGPAGGIGIRGWLSGIYSRLGSPLSVTGTFWQAVQPISGTVTANVSGTIPVSGNFWQTNQPVSLASLPALPAGLNSIGAITNSSFGISGSLPAFAATPTVNIGMAPSIAVTGLFYQATQPVSIAAMPSTPVTGTFWQAMQPVSLAALPSLPVGANLIGAVNLDLGGSAVSAGNPLPVIGACTAPVASAWTFATALNSVSAVATGGYDTVIVTLVGNAALAGGTVAFEVYDGAAWIPVKAGSVSDYTTTSSASLNAGMNRGYQVPVAGFPQFRVRLAGAIGAGTLTVTTIASSAPDTSIVTVGLDPAQPLPAGTNAIGTVLGPLPPSPVTGQQVLTTTAVALPGTTLQNGLVVTALPTNSGTVYIGAAGVSPATGYPLSAGQSMSFAVANASGISIIGTNTTDKVAFAGN